MSFLGFFERHDFRKIHLIHTVILLCIVSCSKGKPSDSENNKLTFPRDTTEGIIDLFDSYACEIKASHLKVELDPKSKEDWKTFRTRIAEGAKEEVNFGGHFIIVEWGCGTECQSGAIIDALTGKIYSIPTSEWGISYKVDSLLLIVNPPGTDSSRTRPEYAFPAYYQWQNDRFQLLMDTRDPEWKN